MKTVLVGALVAGAVGVAQVLVFLEPEKVTDWRTWVIALTGAFVRPAAAYVVAKFATKT